MDHLTIDTVPLAVLPTTGGAAFVVHIDESVGLVRLDPAPSQSADV